MKTQSYLITIPRNTSVHYQEIPVSNIDNNTEQTIDNIVISMGHPLACKKSNDSSHFCLFKNTLYIILCRY